MPTIQASSANAPDFFNSLLAFAHAKGFFTKHNLDVEMYYQGNSGQTLIQALATDKADVGTALIGDWLKPLSQGFDVKLFVGSHGGCLRLLASQESKIQSIADVKGKTIATYGIGTTPQVAFQVTLKKAGIDPETDVEWKVFPFDLVGEAVANGGADLAAHIDPWAYSMQQRYNLKLIADNQSGIYEGRTCCVIGANGAFLENNKDALRRLAQANIEVHDYTWQHADEVASWYMDTLKPGGMSLADLVAVMSNLQNHVHPFGQDLVDEVRIASEYLRFVDVLDASVDPTEFANRITVNLLG